MRPIAWESRTCVRSHVCHELNHICNILLKTLLIHIWDTTRLSMRHDSFIRVRYTARLHEGILMWTSHGTHMNKSWHTYERVMSHICTSHVSHMKESCLTYERVLSYIWTSHVSHMNESCLTYKCDMSRICTSHVSMYDWLMAHIWMSHIWISHASYIRTLTAAGRI